MCAFLNFVEERETKSFFLVRSLILGLAVIVTEERKSRCWVFALPLFDLNFRSFSGGGGGFPILSPNSVLGGSYSVNSFYLCRQMVLFRVLCFSCEVP